MILDKIADGKFVLKTAANMQIKMAVDAEEAPEEFFFLHIKLTPSSSLKISLSCASMLQTSLIVFVRQCYEQGLIAEMKKQLCEFHIEKESVFEIYEQIKTLLTNSSNKDDECKSTYLRELVSRVRFTSNFLIVL